MVEGLRGNGEADGKEKGLLLCEFFEGLYI